MGLGFAGLGLTVELVGDVVGEAFFGGERLVLELFELVQRQVGEKLPVGLNLAIRDAHDFAVHVLWRIVEPDTVTGGFAHLAAVGTENHGDGKDEFFSIIHLLLEIAADEHVEFLVGAADF